MYRKRHRGKTAILEGAHTKQLFLLYLFFYKLNRYVLRFSKKLQNTKYRWSHI